MFLTLCSIDNFFKIRTGFLIKIKIYVVTILNYLNIVKIITRIEIK